MEENVLDKDDDEQYNDGIDGDEDEIIKEEINSKSQINQKNTKNDDEKIRKPGEKQKRRSKNECLGRDYKCGCGKEYLSYPALYTHIKQKHDGKTPEGTNANQIQSGKGRGRPRKNFLLNEETQIRIKRENNRKYNENQSNVLKDFLNNNNCPREYFQQGESKFLNIYKFFGFIKSKDDIMDINSDEYKIQELFSEELINESSGYKKLYECLKGMKSKGISDIDKIEKKEQITCDESFILYLFYISKYIKKDFCKINLMVLKHFRDLVNILGWNLISVYKSLDDEDISKDFSTVKDPLKIPLLANDFFNSYIKEVMKDFDVYFAVVIISHYVFWLYANNLTSIKLNIPTIINEKEQSSLKQNNNEINIQIENKEKEEKEEQMEQDDNL